MKIKITILLFAGLIFGAVANDDNHKDTPADILVFGTFHFANPGLDLVKKDVIDVTSKQSQDYLQSFTQRIASEYKPTAVLVECTSSYQPELDKKYTRYLSGDYQLEVSETYQVGFRVAKLAGIKKVTCFDDKSVQWQAKPLFEYVAQNLPETQKAFEAKIQEITTKQNDMQSTMTLQEILVAYNQPEYDDLNRGLYLWTNDIQNGDNYIGADAAASWWHRNFKMYANIQAAAQNGERVFVIAGQGHTAIFKDFVSVEYSRTATDINRYL